jgi:hypothetical protein
MKYAYVVYEFIILDLHTGAEPSGMVKHVASSLTEAICFIEEDKASEFNWWKIERFEVNRKYNDEYESSYGEPIGWYDNKARKLKKSPFYKILRKKRNK